MMTIAYRTNVHDIGIVAKIQLSGCDDGRLSIIVQSVVAAGLSLFGALKSYAAQSIAEQLNARGVIATRQGSTVLASLHDVWVLPAAAQTQPRPPVAIGGKPASAMTLEQQQQAAVRADKE